MTHDTDTPRTEVSIPTIESEMQRLNGLFTSNRPAWSREMKAIQSTARDESAGTDARRFADTVERQWFNQSGMAR